MPINSDDKMVKTYAWIYATSSSNAVMKMVMKMETTLIAPPMPAPYMPLMMNIRAISTMMMMWPARMLANKRTIRAKGLVMVEISSMMGISGKAFRKMGTSGQRMSFQ